MSLLHNPYSRFALFSLLCFSLSSTLPQLATAQKEAKQKETKIEAKQEDDSKNWINADRPGIADGSTVIGTRRFQIELGYQNEYRKDGTDTNRLQFAPLLLRFGIDSHLEFRVESNFVTFSRQTSVPNGTTKTDGFSPASFGVKWQFQEQKETGKKASLGTIVRVYPASGSSDFKQNHTTGDIRLAADWDFTPNLSLNPNLGIGFYEDGNGETYTAGTLAMTLNYWNRAHKINPFLDFGLIAPEERNGHSSLIFDTGIAFILGPNVQLDFSVGTGSLGRTSPHPFISTGLSIRF